MGKRVIILTHHAPFVAGLVPNISVGHDLLSNGCLGTDLSETFNAERFPHLKYWCYGHTHLSKRIQIGGVKICSNQWGYPQDGWKTQLVGLIPCSGYVTFDVKWKLQLPPCATMRQGL